MISGRLRDRKGWTLIELMIAIAIIGIISAFAIPGYLAGMPLRRLKADAMDITSNLKYAKMKAVQRNINVGVYFNSGGSVVNGVDPNALCVYEESGSTPNVFDNTDNRLKPNIKLKSGVEFDTVSWTINDDNADNNTVIFKPNGSAIFGPVTTGNDSGTVVIKTGSLTRSIVLTKITGRIQVP